MFTLLQSLPARRFFSEQLPAIGGAWVIAELFYKFHSFTAECAAFLATWFVFDALISAIKYLFRAAASCPIKTDH